MRVTTTCVLVEGSLRTARTLESIQALDSLRSPQWYLPTFLLLKLVSQ